MKALAKHSTKLRVIAALGLVPQAYIATHVAGANEHAMPLHQAIAQAIHHHNEQGAEDAMRALVIATLDDIRRAEQTPPSF